MANTSDVYINLASTVSSDTALEIRTDGTWSNDEMMRDLLRQIDV